MVIVGMKLFSDKNEPEQIPENIAKPEEYVKGLTTVYVSINK